MDIKFRTHKITHECHYWLRLIAERTGEKQFVILTRLLKAEIERLKLPETK